MADGVTRQGAVEPRPDPDPATAIPSVAERASEQAPHRIVVVGGGAAGLELATRLGDRLGRRERAHIALVDAARTHLWKPLLHEVAAGARRWSTVGSLMGFSARTQLVHRGLLRPDDVQLAAPYARAGAAWHLAHRVERDLPNALAS